MIERVHTPYLLLINGNQCPLNPEIEPNHQFGPQLSSWNKKQYHHIDILYMLIIIISRYTD